MEGILIQDFEIVFQLVLACLLGGLLGLEREFLKKTAGLRTFILVCMGSTVFAIISQSAYDMFLGTTSFDPSRMASQVIVGIGFLGAGAIIKRGDEVHGVTTAAGIWIAAAVGLAIGTQLYILGIMTAVLSLLVLIIVRKVEFWLNKRT